MFKFIKPKKDFSQDIEKLRKNRINNRVEKEEEFKNCKINCTDEVWFQTIKFNEKCKIFDKKSYNCVAFNKCKFGKVFALEEEEYLVIEGTIFHHVDFNECVFNNIKFIGCHFTACIFENCRIQDLVFENCVFSCNGLEKSNHNLITLPTEFNECIIVFVNFRGCISNNNIYHNCDIILTNYIKSDLNNSFFISCEFGGAKCINSDINKIKILTPHDYDIQFRISSEENIVLDDIYVSNPNYFKIISSILKSKQPFIRTSEHYYTNISKMFNSLMIIMKGFSVNDERIRDFSYYYNFYSFRISKRKTNYFVGLFSWLLCGFGERINRLFLWFITYVLGFSFLYLFNGCLMHN